jgi:hypothetical protein
MAYTVTKLITESYYLSGRLAQGLQTISGQQLAKGLLLLNSVLAVKSVNERLIPYFTKYQFDAVVNQEVYFIPNLIFCETLTFNYQNVRYSMTPMSRRVYQGSDRVNNIASLMFDYNVERCIGGANLSMYFLPDSDYPCTIWGKFSLSAVALNQNLEDSLDTFYIEFLRYALAEYICQDNNIAFQPQNKEKLEEYEQAFMDISTPDLSLVKISGLGGRIPSRWGQANLGRGWTV